MRKKGKRRAWLALAIALAAAGGGAYALLRGRKAEPASAEETAKVEKRAMDDIIEVSGHLKAKDEQEIRSPAAGIVEAVSARSGDRVAPGDPIARLDSTQQAYELDKLAYQIDEERFAGNRRKVELLEVELEARRRAVEDLTMRAHIGGLVSRLELKPGDVLKVGEVLGYIGEQAAPAAGAPAALANVHDVGAPPAPLIARVGRANFRSTTPSFSRGYNS